MSARKLPTEKMLRLIEVGDVEGVRALLDAHPALIRANLFSNDQPLNYAAWQGQLSMARLHPAWRGCQSRRRQRPAAPTLLRAARST